MYALWDFCNLLCVRQYMQELEDGPVTKVLRFL